MDAFWGIFLKENSMIKDFWAMHPSKTMLSKNDPSVSSMVSILDESRYMQNSWLNGDPYYN